MEIGTVGIILLITNVLCSYKGFKDYSFREKFEFNISNIFIYKDYKRLVTSGFLHTDWVHLGFNMLSLYSFSYELEYILGPVRFLALYFGSLIGGNLLALYINRNYGDYSAIGASGAICGVIFGSIALFPDLEIGFFAIEGFGIPSWLFGIIYILYSIKGIKSKSDNIGHGAHLGGALLGLGITVAFIPKAFENNYIIISALAVPILIFLFLIITRPHLLMINGNHFSSKIEKDYVTIEHKYNAEKAKEQAKLDKLLDKINHKGMDGLSTKEKDWLEAYSNNTKSTI